MVYEASSSEGTGDTYQTCRRRPSSVFDALASLTPPSPLLMPSTVRSSWASEEVPIFLFDSNYVEEVAHQRYSMSSTVHALGLPSSVSFHSVKTVQSTGTFGQFRETQCTPIHARLATEALPEPAPKSPCGTVASSSCTSYDAQEMPSVPSARTIMSPPSPSPSVYSTHSCSSSPVRSRFRLGSKYRPMDYSDFASVLCSTSTLSNVSSSNSGSLLSRSTGSRTSQLNDLGRLSSASDPTYSAHPTGKSSASSSMSSATQGMQIPKNLAWLANTVVEMLIDQEGFRSINPTFKFVGYSDNTRSLGTREDNLDGGVAHFMPVTRQTFHFHYALFESQPVLRRVSVNGNARDHISRQAVISLKSNGVYTVCGAETSLVPLSKGPIPNNVNTSEAPKLRWKFDYFVDDKKGSRMAEGEKTFTPLTFACSPLLLHTLQGKKVRLVQVVRKSVVTKLVAEKMEPPIPSVHPPSPVSLRTPTSPSGRPSHAGSPNIHLWGRHRRIQSHGPTVNEKVIKYDISSAQVSRPLGHQVNEEYALQRQVGGDNEDLRAGDNGWAGMMSSRLARRSLPASGDSSHFVKHIVVPSKLSELLGDADSHTLRQPEGTRSLSPAPRSQKTAMPRSNVDK